MRLNPNLVLRQVGDEYMIVNPFSDTIDMTQIHTLNETAAWIWKKMEGKEFTIEDIKISICEEYEIDEETAIADATELCELWKKNGLLIS